MITSKTILVVEDDTDIRDSLREILEEEGYDVIHATNGQEAIEHLKKDLHPGLILLDLMMPGMDGWDFLESRRKLDPMSRIPVVVLSALKLPVMHSDVTLALQKPISLDKLVEVAKKYCGPSN